MRQAKKIPTPKQKKSDKLKNWIVVVKGEYINAAINNHVNTESTLIGLGYKVVGYPAMEDKSGAIDLIEAYTGKYYKREKKKK